MSLLARIQEKKKNLTNCPTTVTKLSGEKYLETLDTSGCFKETKLVERHAGYIVDLQPDFQVAQVLPYLTFGSQDVISNFDVLKSNGITHVLSLGVKPTIQFDRVAYKFFDFLDSPEESLLEILPQTNSLIESVKNVPLSKVFVHCNAGCSRAPSVVIGYLMWCFHYSYKDAYQLVGDKRYIRPNDGFVKQLKRYETQISKIRE